MSDSILDSVRDVGSAAGGSPPSPASSSPGQESKRSLMMAVAIVLLLIIVFHALTPRGLSHKLAKRGWVLFVRDGCGYCTKQLKVLGGDYPKIVECAPGGKLVSSFCDEPPFACSQVSGFPTFYNTISKKLVAGLQSKENLEQMCDGSD